MNREQQQQQQLSKDTLANENNYRIQIFSLILYRNFFLKLMLMINERCYYSVALVIIFVPYNKLEIQ